MSYANGIGSEQQVLSSITTPKAEPLSQVAAATGPAAEASSATVEHADQASLSSSGGLVAQAMEGSDVRTDKVASLQQAIAAGTYSVSSSDVADKIIQSLLD
jgi:negative regulator of flagellin synthesis FlgM